MKRREEEEERRGEEEEELESVGGEAGSQRRALHTVNHINISYEPL